MRKTINILVSLLVMMTSLNSCLSGKDEAEVVYYNDTAITSVVLGTMTRTVHTTSSKGLDSTYIVSYAGSQYPMFIDQSKNQIYNVDSLPKGTKQKMLVTVSALNSSYTFVKSLTSDSLTSCNGDSIDFSQPRVLRVFSSDGKTHRDYSMEVRIHQENENEYNWFRCQDAPALAPLADMRGLSVGNKLFVYGVANGSSTKAVYTTDINDGNNWTLASESLAADADIVADGSNLYALSGGKVFMSADGANWNVIADAPALKHLVAATGEKLYATKDHGIVFKEYTGTEWYEDNLDDDATFLPTADINAVIMNQSANADLKKLFVIGRRKVADEVSGTEVAYNDSTAVIWSHIEGEKIVEEQQPWMHQGYGRETVYVALALKHLTIVPYNGAMLLIGGKGTGKCTQDALSGMVCSYDQGLTWKTDKILSLPKELSSNESSFAMIADKNNFLWIIAGNTGQVWRGTFTQMQWEEK